MASVFSTVIIGSTGLVRGLVIPSVYPHPTPDIFFSDLGTTRAIAGSAKNHYKMDHDLNLELATVAKKASNKVYDLISSTGADAHSFFTYPRDKGELEEDVNALGFEKAIILRPGLIVGDRVGYNRHGLHERALMGNASFAGWWTGGMEKDFRGQVAQVIWRAVWIMDQGDIVRLERTEWKD